MLVVFIIGSVDPKLLGKAQRVKEYCPGDFDILYTYLSLFSEIILLPNTVSEASTFLTKLKGERRQACLEILAGLTLARSEKYVPSDLATKQSEYMALGVTDAAILCALEEGTYLLTADRDLQIAALCRNHEAQHFEELRD